MGLLQTLYAYDLRLVTSLYKRFGQNASVRFWGEVFSHTGDGFLWLLTIPPLLAVAWVLGYLSEVSLSTQRFSYAFYTCMVVDIIAVMAIKYVVKRNRPPYHVTDVRYMGPDQHSFPSGHATRVWCVVAFLLRLAETHPELISDFFNSSPELVVALSIVWALAINFSRIALGHHYPSDVLAGSLIGFFVFYPISEAFIDHFEILSRQ